MVRTGKYEVLSEYTILENYKMVVDSPIWIEWEKRNLEGYAQNNVVCYSTDIESGRDCISITIADNGEIYRSFLSTLSKKAHKEGFSMVIVNEKDNEYECSVHLQFSISWSKK